MRCKIESELRRKGDRLYFVRRDAFKAIADPIDFGNRVSRNIERKYCAAWFKNHADGYARFVPPAFYLKHGAAFGINGRHRAAVLMLCLDEFPLAITMADDASGVALAALVVREIKPEEIFELPDLPKWDCPPG